MASRMQDDGHVSKVLRSLKHAEDVAGKQTRFPEPLEKEKVLDIARVMMKSVEGETNAMGSGGMWTRGAGYKEAWEGYPIAEGREERGRL